MDFGLVSFLTPYRTMTAKHYAADREVSLGRFGSLAASVPSHTHRVQLIDEFRRELTSTVLSVMAANVSSAGYPAETRTAIANLQNGNGVKTLACIFEASVNPKNGISYALAQNLVRMQSGFLDRYHPQASADALRWCPVAEEQAVEWESQANDVQDAATRAALRHPTGVAEAVAVIESTIEQRVSGDRVIALQQAKVAHLTGGRVRV